MTLSCLELLCNLLAQPVVEQIRLNEVIIKTVKYEWRAHSCASSSGIEAVLFKVSHIQTDFLSLSVKLSEIKLIIFNAD